MPKKGIRVQLQNEECDHKWFALNVLPIFFFDRYDIYIYHALNNSYILFVFWNVKILI